jgi:hypothetical protein
MTGNKGEKRSRRDCPQLRLPSIGDAQNASRGERSRNGLWDVLKDMHLQMVSWRGLSIPDYRINFALKCWICEFQEPHHRHCWAKGQQIQWDLDPW